MVLIDSSSITMYPLFVGVAKEPILSVPNFSILLSSPFSRSEVLWSHLIRLVGWLPSHGLKHGFFWRSAFFHWALFPWKSLDSSKHGRRRRRTFFWQVQLGMPIWGRTLPPSSKNSLVTYFGPKKMDKKNYVSDLLIFFCVMDDMLIIRRVLQSQAQLFMFNRTLPKLQTMVDCGMRCWTLNWPFNLWKLQPIWP